MTLELAPEIVKLINGDGTVKVLSLLDDGGIPCSAVKMSLRIRNDGLIEFHEFLETSNSYKYFTRSLWFNQKISIAVIGQNGESCIIKGTPLKIVICGSMFEENYSRIRKEFGDVDLAAVCIIEPDELIIEPQPDQLIKAYESKPIFTHLDRLAADNVLAGS